MYHRLIFIQANMFLLHEGHKQFTGKCNSFISITFIYRFYFVPNHDPFKFQS